MKSATPRTSEEVLTFSLPAASLGTFEVLHRNLQYAADAEAGSAAQEGDAHWIDKSKALVHILHLTGLFAAAASHAGMSLSDAASALSLGGLRLAPASDVAPRAAAPKLSAEMHAHLSSYREARGLENEAVGLLEIIETHMLMAEMANREGRSMNTLPEAIKVANQWLLGGLHGEVLKINGPSATAH